jgi:hypothetical protein
MSTREVPGSGAVLRPNFNSEYGVSSIDVLNGGAGYASTDPPKIEISGTKVPLVEGLFYPVIVDGSIRRVAILNSGSGYFPTTEDLGTQVGIATTSYVESSLIVRKGPDTAPYLSVASTESSIIMQVEGGNGTSIFENGYNVAISTAIVGTSASITPDFSLNQNRFYGFFDPFPAYSTSGVGTGAKFNVFIVYNSSTGYPISTSLVLREGGRGYAVGDTVSISGTFMNGTSPTNDLSFTVSSVANTRIVGQAGSSYSNLPSSTIIGFGSGARFNVSRNSFGDVSSITVANGGVGYALTDKIKILGSSVGGVTPADDLYLTPKVLGTDKLPSTLYVSKIDNDNYKVSGLSTSNELDIISYGTGYQSFTFNNPNASAIISVDNIIQSPLYKRDLSVSLVSIVGVTTDIIYLSGISSITSLDTIQIDSEYLKINTIGIGSTNAFNVTRGYLGSRVGYHTVGAAVTILRGDFNISKDEIHFTTPPYGPSGYEGLKITSSFSGRAFTRKFDPGTPNDKNVIFDDISTKFVGASSTEFFLQNYDQDIVGIYTNTNTVLTSSIDVNNNPIVLINNIPQISNTDFVIDNPAKNRIKFLTGTPGAGKIVRTGITTGYGYQPLVGAGATVTVSAAGTISAVTIKGFGSGYRTPPKIEILSNVGTGASLVAIIGTGGTITSISIVNPGTGYTTSPVPRVLIGIPSSYSDLPLEYISGSTGNGFGAKASVIVGNQGNVIGFDIEEPGLYYKVGDVLKVVGVTTNPSIGIGFSEFRITVEETLTDKFSGFYPGQFIQFDDIAKYFTGSKKKFTLTISQGGTTEVLSLKSDPSTDVQIENNLFVFINDVLQEPIKSYTFNGSRLTFTEAPKENSKCTILFFRGSDLDVEQIDPPKTIKEGDTIQIGENILDPGDRPQFERIVKKIVSSDALDTFTYDSIGINTDVTKERPLRWAKQTVDRIINGVLYSKSRPDLKSRITPNTKLIANVFSEDEKIYVNNAFPLFSEVDLLSENLRDVIIVDVNDIQPAISTAIVSSASTISSLSISYAGTGYNTLTNPIVAISSAFIQRKDPIYNWKGSNNGISSSYTLNKVVIGNPIVSVGSSGIVAISTNGIEWSQSSIGYGQTISFNSVSVAEPNRYYVVGEFAKIATSVGINTTLSAWTEIKLLEEQVVVGLPDPIINFSSYYNTFNDISYSSLRRTAVAVGDGIGLFTGVGIGTTAFFKKNPPVFTNLNGVANNDARFVVVGDSGTIIHSTNGNIWDRIVSLPTTRNFEKVIWTGTQFVAVGQNATIFVSTTGNTGWERIIPNISDDLINIKYEYGVYVALTGTNQLLFSLDLQYWTQRLTNQNNVVKDLAFIPAPLPPEIRPIGPIIAEEGRYLLVGTSGTTMYAEPIYNRATGVSTVSNGAVSSIRVVNPGFGYSQSTPPPVLLEGDDAVSEKIYSIKSKGDFGVITYVGVGATHIDFVLKSEQYDNVTLGIGYSSLNTFGVTNSQLEVNDYFVIYNSNSTVGHALTGITTSMGGMNNYPASRVGTATSYLDGVYRVGTVSPAVSGIVTVRCYFTTGPGNIPIQVDTNTNENGIYGKYTWGKIYDFQNRTRFQPRNFPVNTNNGLIGLSTAPDVYRTRGLK